MLLPRWVVLKQDSAPRFPGVCVETQVAGPAPVSESAGLGGC